MKVEEIQKIVDDMKEPLQEYWTNEVGLPLSIQLHSMALMDMYIDKLSNQSSTTFKCPECGSTDIGGAGCEEVYICKDCNHMWPEEDHDEKELRETLEERSGL